MERQPINDPRGAAQEAGLSALDAAPDQGPAVFVTQPSALEALGIYHGGWVDAALPETQLHDAVAQAVGVGAFEAGDWSIVDQLDIGPLMLPERLSLSALHRIARRYRRDPEDAA